MTEEIIIDGVNVAGCEYYTTIEDCDGIHDLCEQLDDYCSIKKGCYYKQLKRLEQENKKYYQQTLDDEITISDLITKCNDLERENRKLRKANEISIEKVTVTAEAKRLQELEQENKELRAKIESFMNGDYCADGCKKMNNAFCDAHAAIINENNKYRSALEEINITVKQLLQGVTSNCINNTPYLTALSLIENKINEVLDVKHRRNK